MQPSISLFGPNDNNGRFRPLNIQLVHSFIAVTRCLYTRSIGPAVNGKRSRIDHNHNAQNSQQNIRRLLRSGPGYGLEMEESLRILI